MKQIKTQDAVGHALIHDIVRIVIGDVKETAFSRGHVIGEEDVPKLLDLGKEHIYVMEPSDDGFLHEETVAQALYDIAKGTNMHDGPMSQGKIEAIADVDGLLKVDVEKLHAINSIGDLTIVTKLNNSPVKAGEKIAGMRCIPLLLDEREVKEAECIGGPILNIKPFVRKTMGIVTTGSEVFEGRITDAFTPIIEERCAEFGVKKIAHEIVTDDTDLIVAAIDKVKAAGADIIFCTGGMSVDPDDLTPGAIKRYADTVVTYGLPVLPGSMVCIAYCDDGTPILGVPGGVLFSKPTAFDAIVPRLVADDRITNEDCIAMGHGGFLG
ncbi:molybdopterin-binding protein [Veillonella agrestimuris]|uniref:molybdopterin-binding protein n=1 Tax=Veillonella agrestimuris TaxID=2941340 RepID=UPI002040B18E|nr:molybdopterin-binding protein [Veillonella agrestimuris]